MTPFLSNTFTVLERAWTVSGMMLVALNVFDWKLPAGSRLVNTEGKVWEIIKQYDIIGRSSDNELQEKMRTLGAILFHIEPIGHNILPGVGDELFVESNDG